jgi:UDP-N-acetylmuramoyl-tripeptide--D-alanyl-D-alanine ligase
MANALDTLAQLARQKQQRAVFVAGSMGELGEASATLHRQLGQQAAAAGVGCLLACGAFADAIAAGAIAAGLDATACKTYKTTAELCDNVHNFIRPADIILVKGSRSAGLEKAVEALKKELTRDDGQGTK